MLIVVTFVGMYVCGAVVAWFVASISVARFLRDDWQRLDGFGYGIAALIGIGAAVIWPAWLLLWRLSLIVRRYVAPSTDDQHAR